MDGTTGITREVRNYELAFKPGSRQMGMIEGLVWDAFLRKYSEKYDRIGENVPVWLDPPEIQGILKPSKRRLVDPPSYRVDAIAGNRDYLELIEVKETGNMTAIGQLLTYQMLFMRTYWGYKELAMRLVCRRAPPPIRFACEKLSIGLTEVGDSIDEQVKLARRIRSDSRVVDQG